MNQDTYRRLAKHLDNIPAGYPATDSGVEIRILQRLFSPDEATLATHLTLLPEDARVVARRAKLPVDEVAQRLAKMEQKGLIFSKHSRSGSVPKYQAAPFVVGIWEFQVGRLTPDLVRDFEEYLPHLMPIWKKTPQMRTIPINESIDTEMKILPTSRPSRLSAAKT